jgi:replicative DNA helicase
VGTIEYQSEEFRKAPLFIDDTPSLSIFFDYGLNQDVWFQKHGIQIIIVDYFAIDDRWNGKGRK